MSTRQADAVASSENGSAARKAPSHDVYDADDESDPEPTTLEDALQMMQNRMRSSGLSTSKLQQRDQPGRAPPHENSQGAAYGHPIPWTGAIVDLRCSEPEKFWKPTYDASECNRPRDPSSRPPHSAQGMPSASRSKPTSNASAPQRTKGPPTSDQRWRAEVK